MNMQFKNIQNHIHQGRRDYQEDSFAIGTDFILVSDGVGGLAKGNIASDIVTRTWQAALEDKKVRLSSLQEDVQTLVDSTLQTLLNFASENPESQGMGATIACAAWFEDSLVSIHIGDSRIYHFSSTGTLLWRSKDHSLVQELVDAGVLSAVDAADHPRKNIITRALQAKEGNHVIADVHILNELHDGDQILVCSDGVVEAWPDKALIELMKQGLSPEQIMKSIADSCEKLSRDNNTAVLAQVIRAESNGSEGEEK